MAPSKYGKTVVTIPGVGRYVCSGPVLEWHTEFIPHGRSRGEMIGVYGPDKNEEGVLRAIGRDMQRRFKR